MTAAAPARLHEEAAPHSLLRVFAESLETVATQACGLAIGIPMLAITAHWLGSHGREGIRHHDNLGEADGYM
jgi:hypothetical protein